jgi:hypothetical protein
MAEQKSKRNRLAGTTKGKSDSAKFYHENEDARKKKEAYDKKFHATTERKKYRAELNKENRKSTYKVGDGKDASHTKSGKMVLENQSANRARNRGKK